MPAYANSIFVPHPGSGVYEVPAVPNTIYYVDTKGVGPGGKVRFKLPSWLTVGPADIIGIKKLLRPAHGGVVSAVAAENETVESQLEIGTEKNGFMMVLGVVPGLGWALLSDWPNFKGPVISNHHTVSAAAPVEWSVEMKIMAGEILVGDGAPVQGFPAREWVQMVMRESLADMAEGYVPTGVRIRNGCSQPNNPNSLPRRVAFRYLPPGSKRWYLDDPPGNPTGSIMQGYDPAVLDGWGDGAELYSDGGELWYVSHFSAHPAELCSLMLSPSADYFQRNTAIDSSKVYAIGYGKGCAVAIPSSSASGIRWWRRRDFFEGAWGPLHPSEGTVYGYEGQANAWHDIYIRTIPEGYQRVESDLPGDARLILGPPMASVPTDETRLHMWEGGFVNKDALNLVWPNTARWLGHIKLNAQGLLDHGNCVTHVPQPV